MDSQAMQQQLTTSPEETLLTSRIFKAKINPHLYPGLKFTIVKNDDWRVEIIKELLPKYYGKTFEQIDIKDRHRDLCQPRQHFMFLVLKNTSLTLRKVGNYFNSIKMDHSSVIHARDTWQDLLDTDKEIRSLHNKFNSELKTIFEKV